jgi:hypothetical protein
MIVRTYFPSICPIIVEHLSIAGDVIAPTRPDLPRGLNQLGNTCYLNSLLQVAHRLSYYFGYYRADSVVPVLLYH